MIFALLERALLHSFYEGLTTDSYWKRGVSIRAGEAGAEVHLIFPIRRDLLVHLG